MTNEAVRQVRQLRGRSEDGERRRGRHWKQARDDVNKDEVPHISVLGYTVCYRNQVNLWAVKPHVFLIKAKNNILISKIKNVSTLFFFYEMREKIILIFTRQDRLLFMNVG